MHNNCISKIYDYVQNCLVLHERTFLHIHTHTCTHAHAHTHTHTYTPTHTHTRTHTEASLSVTDLVHCIVLVQGGIVLIWRVVRTYEIYLVIEADFDRCTVFTLFETKINRDKTIQSWRRRDDIICLRARPIKTKPDQCSVYEKQRNMKSISKEENHSSANCGCNVRGGIHRFCSKGRCILRVTMNAVAYTIIQHCFHIA